MKKTTRALVATVALACLVLVAGCKATQNETPEDVPVQAGDIEIRLNYNAGTGYEWSYAADPEGILDEIAVETVDQSESDTTSGGPLQDVYTFDAASPGRVTITFTLSRPWEEANDTDPIETYVFDVAEDLSITFDAGASTYTNEPVVSKG